MNKELSANTNLSHYRIVAKIGEGGMGEVYLAQDTRLDRKIALKLLPAEFTKHEDRVRRFIQEAKAASALNHPNIITIHEIGEVDGTQFIATEFIEGETLRSYMRRERLTVPNTLDIAAQVAGALAAAHKAGIVHRDIKPENIMLREDGIVKVLDFGLAKLTKPQTSSTDTTAPTVAKLTTEAGTIMGTINYMSPEQARGKPEDARSDIFSLGVVVYEMIAGHAPFEAETLSDVMSFILHKEPQPLVRYSPEIPAELERIVAKALVKDREERYQSAKDLLIDLKRLKARQELEAELARLVSPESSASAGLTTGGVAAAQARTMQSGLQSEPVKRTTSSAEYLVSQIKQHKRVALLALLLLLVSLAGLGYFYLDRSGGAIDSLAIMPFVNASGDPNAEYLSDGLTESLIYNLSQLQSLRVLPRSSVFRYKGKESDPQTVSRELGVRAVLVGRVVQRGEDLSISAELIDTRENKVLWGQQYNRKFSDVLAVQEEIAREISDRLRLKLSGEQQKQLTKRYTENTEAYQLYLKGNYYTAKLTKDGLRKGLEYFNQSLEKDPNYALAYNGLAYYYVFADEWFLSPKEAMPKTRQAAKKALAIDETLADAHASLATVAFWHDWDWAAAEREYKRAIELNPNAARTHYFYAWYLISVGRTDQALAEAKRAQELDPISAEVTTFRGFVLFFARQYDQAIEQLRKAVDLDSNYWFAHLFLGQAFEQQGKLTEAIAEFQRARQLEGEVAEIWAMLGHAYALSGKRSEAQKVIAELNEQPARIYVPSYMGAIVYAGLGDKDQSFAWLDRAYTERSAFLTWLTVDPVWDNLRSDPRFADLLRRVGLSQ